MDFSDLSEMNIDQAFVHSYDSPMKRIILFLTLVICLFLFASCDDSTSSSSSSDANDVGSKRDIDTLDTDYSSVSYAATLYINVADQTYKTASGDSYTSIPTSDTTILDSISIKYKKNRINIDISEYTSNLALNITGTATSACSVKVKTRESSGYTLGVTLDSATIISDNFPCLDITNCDKVIMNVTGTNSFTDGRSYGTDYSDYSDHKGTLYTKGALVLYGTGSLSITEGYKHAVYSDDYIHILNGTYTTSSTGRDGFRVKNAFIMDDGTVSISGTGNNTNNESRGIVVEGSEDDYANEGYVEIRDGSITINTVGKGITAKWDVDDDAETSSTSDDPDPYVKIEGGTISVTTTGTPYEGTSSTTVTDADGEESTETPKLAPEGIEGKEDVYITGGTITISATDDCINAGDEMNISGGTIYAVSSSNDALDSNGDMNISGGTIVALASSSPECAFDCDESATFTISGGLIAGIGTNNYSVPEGANQGTIVLSGSYFGSDTVTIQDSSDNIVYAYDIPAGYTGSSYILILSGSGISLGNTYKVVTGTASGGSETNGLYTTMPTSLSSTSTTASNITVSSSSPVSTTYAGSGNGGPKEGSKPSHP